MFPIGCDDLKITENVIPHIERALRIKLYDDQIKYLLNEDFYMSGGRRSGKTLAHCVRLALSDGEPLELKQPEKFSDYGDGSIRYARNFYKNEFLKVREMLKDYGLPVRDVKK